MPGKDQPEAWHFSTTLGRYGGVISLDMAQTEEKDGFISKLRRGEEILSMVNTEQEPWLFKKNAKELAKQAISGENDYKATVIEEEILKVFEDFKSSPDVQAVTSNIVMKVIEATKKTEWELTDPPRFIVHLENKGKTEQISFSSKDIAKLSPLDLNEKWVCAFRETLKANKKDFEQISDHWIEIAGEVQPIGDYSEWETFLTSFRKFISQIPLESDKSALGNYGIFLEGDIIWIDSNKIDEVGAGEFKTGDKRRFADFLYKKKYLVKRSTLKRVGEFTIRAWGFTRDFHIKNAGQGEFREMEAIK